MSQTIHYFYRNFKFVCLLIDFFLLSTQTLTSLREKNTWFLLTFAIPSPNNLINELVVLFLYVNTNMNCTVSYLSYIFQIKKFLQILKLTFWLNMVLRWRNSLIFHTVWANYVWFCYSSTLFDLQILVYASLSTIIELLRVYLKKLCWNVNNSSTWFLSFFC